MTQVTLADVEFVAFELAREKLSFQEPIPDFSSRLPDRLESCLITPFMEFGGKSPYRSFEEKASVLLYLMIKNHPFQNGNKRIAMTTLMAFLFLNEKWLEADIQELYNFTVWVAGSPADLKDEVVSAIRKFLDLHIVDAGLSVT